MNLPTMLLRADSGPVIGAGHVMRCLALAQAWAEAGGTARFVAADDDPAFRRRLAAEGIACDVLGVPIADEADAEETCRIAREHDAGWIVLDGYRFGTAYQRALCGGSWRVLQIEDYGQTDWFEVDVLLNQNIYADPGMYSGKVRPGADLLLGSGFALLRKEFWSFRGDERHHSGRVRKIVVTLGGSDPDNLTLTVLQGLELLAPAKLEVAVVIGGANPHGEMIREAVGHMKLHARIERNVSDMPSILREADLAVSAGGATCWELAFLGLPMATVVLADNQRRIAEGLAAAGISVNLGWHGDLSPEKVRAALAALLADSARVRSMGRLGRKLVDGFGARRVAGRLVRS